MSRKTGFEFRVYFEKLKRVSLYSLQVRQEVLISLETKSIISWFCKLSLVLPLKKRSDLFVVTCSA